MDSAVQAPSMDGVRERAEGHTQETYTRMLDLPFSDLPLAKCPKVGNLMLMIRVKGFVAKFTNLARHYFEKSLFCPVIFQRRRDDN